MVDGGSKGRGSRGRGTSSRGRGRGAEPPPPRPPPPRREEAPAHNHEPAADADVVADDEEYLALAASITHMMRDEVASRDKLTKRVSELESALTAAHAWRNASPPIGMRVWLLLRLFRACLTALGGSVLPGAGETGPLGAQPPPRMLERTASKVVDATHPRCLLNLSRRHARRWRTCARATATYKGGCVTTQPG